MNDQVTREETAELLRLAEQSLSVPGDLVELGCYRGDTSVLLGQLLQKLWKSCGKLVENSQISVENHSGKVEKVAEKVENFAPNCAELGQSCANHVQNSVENPKTHPKTQPETQPKTQLETSPLNSQTSSNKAISNPGLKHLWIYDSFAGLPAKTAEDSSGAGANFQQGELLVTKREVVEKLRKHGLRTSGHPDPTSPNVIIKKAWFDELQDQDLPEQIAFAFLDGDLYSSIKTSLYLVKDRLARQGTIVVHDYNNPELPGSARAVDEFLKTHPGWKLQIRHTLAILNNK